MTAIELPKKTHHDQIIEEEITKDNLAETGTAINLDINNKPLESKTNFISDFSSILQLMKRSTLMTD